MDKPISKATQRALDLKANKSDATPLPQAGTATLPVMQFSPGTLLSTPQNGAFEYDGTHLYFTIQDVRHKLVMAPVENRQESLNAPIIKPAEAIEKSGENSVGNNQENLNVPVLVPGEGVAASGGEPIVNNQEGLTGTLITPIEGDKTSSDEAPQPSLAEQKV
jgi:hypothetical protein